VEFDPTPEFFTLPSPASITSRNIAVRPPLHIAVHNNNETIIRLLLQQGADFSRLDQNGKTALHAAVESGRLGLVTLLLAGNDANVKDSSGRTALFSAVQAGNDEITRALLEGGIDVTYKDPLGETALHVAVESGSESSTMLLLKHGADINA
jgi:ankyrin repeat protein